MNIARGLLVGITAAMLVSTQVIAQDTPSSGSVGNSTASWATMPVGSYVMIGGLIFVITVSGLVLLDDDDDNTSSTTTTTAPTTTPSTTTTTMTTTTTS